MVVGGEGGPHTPNFLFLWVTCVQFPLPRHPTTTSSPPLLRTEKRGTTCRVAVTRLVSHFGPPMDESRSPQHVGSEGGGGWGDVFFRLFFRLLPVSTTTVFWVVCFVCVSPLKLQLNTRCYCCCYKSLKPRSSQFVGPARSIFFFYKQADKGQPSPSPCSLLRPLHRQRPLPIAYVNWLLDRFALCWRGFFWMLLWWWWLGQMSAAMQW